MVTQVPEGMTFWEFCSMTRWGAYTTEVERNLLVTALSLAGGTGTALEVGCEGGRWSKLIAESGWQTVCTDVDEKVLRICQNRLPEARCILVKHTDTALPCSSNSLKMLVCIEVWQLGNQDWLFGEAQRVLEMGGLFVITCANRLSWRGLYSVVRGVADKWYPGTYLECKRKLRKRGFSVLRETGYAWFPFSRLSNSRWVPLCIRIEQFLCLRHLTTLSPWIAVIALKNQRIVSSLTAATRMPGERIEADFSLSG